MDVILGTLSAKDPLWLNVFFCFLGVDEVKQTEKALMSNARKFFKILCSVNVVFYVSEDVYCFLILRIFKNRQSSSFFAGSRCISTWVY